MAKLNEADLKTQIKNSDLKNLYLLYGEEKMLVAVYSKKLKEKAVGKTPSDFYFHSYNEDSTVDEIIKAVEIIPFGCMYNYVLIENLSFEKLKDDEITLLLKALEDVPPSTIVAIAMTTAVQGTKKAKFWKKLVDIADKYGVAVEFKKKTVQDLRKQLISWASKRNIVLSAENAIKIIEYSGTDLNTLKNELDKLCAYVNEGEITVQHIEAVVTKNLATRVFDMTKAVVNGEWDSAFEKLDLLFYQREEPIMILAELSNTYTDMYRARVAVESGMRAEDVAKDFDYARKEFRLKNAEKASSGITTDDICKCLEYLALTNTAMNSSSANKRLLLEQLVAKLIITRKQVRR